MRKISEFLSAKIMVKLKMAKISHFSSDLLSLIVD